MLLTPCFTDVNTTTPADCMHRFLVAMIEQQPPTSTRSAAAAVTVPAASNVQYPQYSVMLPAYAPGNMPPPGASSPPDDVNQVSSHDSSIIVPWLRV